ncbi:MAG: hypothetical protein JXJ18_14155 [Rhodobacteraceae bacterium]|nr:hypothetical protein [Paracoccaceae bacterium]
MLTRDTLFRPVKPQTKADTTTEIARGIIQADADAREAKTHRLRTARLEREAFGHTQQPASPDKKPRKKPAVNAKTNG